MSRSAIKSLATIRKSKDITSTTKLRLLKTLVAIVNCNIWK